MKKILTYLSFTGRANRQRYWTLSFLLVVGFLIAMMLSFGMADIVPILGIVFVPVLLAFLVAGLANTVLRLHDRNKSAWWLLLFVGVPTILSLPGDIAEASKDEGAMAFGGLCALLSLPFSIWGLVEMGFLKGTSGSNKYGEDPLASPVAEVFA